MKSVDENILQSLTVAKSKSDYRNLKSAFSLVAGERSIAENEFVLFFTVKISYSVGISETLGMGIHFNKCSVSTQTPRPLLCSRFEETVS